MGPNLADTGISISDFLAILVSLVAIGGAAAQGIRIILDPKKRDWKVILGTIAVMCVVLVVAIMIHNFTTISIKGTTSLFGQATPSPTSTPEPSLTPTPTPIVVNENLTIPCVSGYCSDQMTVRLTTIMIDSANQQMTWNFTLTALTDGTFHFVTIFLEDASTTQYPGTGQATDSWGLKAGDPINVSPIFKLVPQHEVPYSLHLAIAYAPGGGFQAYYETKTFTFP